MYLDYTFGVAIDINYERMVVKRKAMLLIARVGYGFVVNSSANIGANISFGKKRSYFELGVCLHTFFTGGIGESEGKLALIPSIGYRYQRPEGCFFFRANVRIVPFDGSFFPVPGLGIGHTF